MPLFEEPKRKPGDALALALANLGGTTPSGNNPMMLAGLQGLPSSGISSAMGGSTEGDVSTTSGGMGGGLAGGYAGPTGPLGSTLGMGVGLANMGMKSLGTLGGLFGLGALAPMGLAAAPLGYVSLASKLASMFGVQPGWGFEAPDYQGIRDYAGAFAEKEAGLRTAADWSSAVDEANAQATRSQAELSAQGTTGGEGPSPGNESGAQGGGFGTGGGEDAYAKGGAKVFTGPSRPLVGERGSELGIFVKPEMTQPGIQGNERQVRSALMRAILSLR